MSPSRPYVIGLAEPRRDPAMRYVGGVIALLLLIAAPNLIWLGASTVQIHNASNQVIPGVAYLACETTHPVGIVKPRETIFRFLPACGDDTLEILIGEARFCQTYVEGELYHVDATLTAVHAADCRYGDPLSSLLIVKVLR